MVELQTTWSWLPAIYLFLGGLGAGAFLTVSILRLFKPGQYKKTILGGVWTATGALAIGLFALIAEVEKPFQAMLMYMSFVNASSWMTIGAWLLLVTFIIFVLSAIMTTDKLADWVGSVIKPLGSARAGINKVLAIAGIPCSVAIAAYTGILLGAAPAIPLWNTDLLPILFAISAFDTGVAAVSIFAVVFEKEEGIEAVRAKLELAVVGLIILEAMVLGAFLVTMPEVGITEALSVSLLTEGALSMQFWGLVVVVGLAIPFVAALAQVIAAKQKSKAHMPMAVSVGGAVCALIGGFTLRYVILSAGIHAALVSPDVVQAAQGISFFVA